MDKFKWYRKWRGGIWYKYELAKELPGFKQRWWEREPLPNDKNYKLIITEDYTENEESAQSFYR